MLIGYDRAQKSGKHELKHRQLQELGHELVDIPCPVGDYVEITPRMFEVMRRRGAKLKKMDLIGLISTSVDTKRDCEELYQCLVQSHARFSDECRLAFDNGIRLVILTENTEGIRSLEQFAKWKNREGWKRYSRAVRMADYRGKPKPKPPVPAEQLVKTMRTMAERYSVEFQFCDVRDTGRRIVEILEEG